MWCHVHSPDICLTRHASAACYVSLLAVVQMEYGVSGYKVDVKHTERVVCISLHQLHGLDSSFRQLHGRWECVKLVRKAKCKHLPPFCTGSTPHLVLTISRMAFGHSHGGAGFGTCTRSRRCMPRDVLLVTVCTFRFSSLRAYTFDI